MIHLFSRDSIPHRFMKAPVAAIALGLLMLLCIPLSNAVTMDGLYDAEVDVASQSDENREAGIRAAFGQVLIKLTGDRRSLTQGPVQAAMVHANEYLQQYRFRDAPVLNNDGTPTGATKQVLWAGFDANEVNQVLQNLNFPVWGKSRPLVLVWLAIEQQGQRNIVDPAMNAGIKDAVERFARQRGLPVVFPLWDLEDQRQLQITDVWGNFTERIMAASARYRTNAVLVGRLVNQRAGDWRGRWTLYEQGNTSDYDASGASAPDAIAGGIDVTSDSLAQRYAQRLTAGASETLTMAVLGVDNFVRYGKLIRYLQSLDVVTNLQVLEVKPTTVNLALALKGQRQGLQQIITLGELLAPAESSASAAHVVSDAASHAPDLIYRMTQ